MASKDYTVGRRESGQWYVKRNDASRAAGVFDTQRQAATLGRELAKGAKSELVIKGENGRIVSKDSYGSDPRRIRDTEH